jgi:hypothetical protein
MPGSVVAWHSWRTSSVLMLLETGNLSAVSAMVNKVRAACFRWMCISGVIVAVLYWQGFCLQVFAACVWGDCTTAMLNHETIAKLPEYEALPYCLAPKKVANFSLDKTIERFL